jgi:hypothetical protein
MVIVAFGCDDDGDGTPKPQCNLPYTDDFNDGNDDGWTHWCPGSGCEWKVQNGVYEISSGGGVAASTFDASKDCSNYVYEVKVKKTGADAMVIFRVTDTDSCYSLNIRGSELDLTHRHRSCGGSHSIATVPFTGQIGTWYQLKIIAVGTRIQVFVDDAKYIDVVDSGNCVAPMLTGPVGVWVHTNNPTAIFDDVRVTPAEIPACDLPVTDNFGDGNDNGWTHAVCYSGTCTWEVIDGVYKGTGQSGPGASLFNLTENCADYTYEIDVKGAGADRHVIFRANFSPDNYYQLNLRSDVVELTLERRQETGDTRLATASYPGSADKWYHVKIVCVGARIQVVVDGTKYIDVVDPDPILEGPVGVWAHTNQSCMFDNVSVTVPELLTTPCDPPPTVGPGTLALWHLDEASGATVSDESSNQYDGTIHGAVWTSGSVGSALLFDGIDDYVQVDAPGQLAIGESLAVEACVYFDTFPTGVTQMATIVGQGGFDVGEGFELQIAYELNQVWVAFTVCTTTFPYCGNASTKSGDATFGCGALEPGSWHHILGTWDGAWMRVYIDGDLCEQTDLSGPAKPSTRPIEMGRRSPGNSFRGHFNGKIDEVHVTTTLSGSTD